MHIAAIVLAAGKGIRFASKIPKPLVKINSQPIIIYSLNVLSRIKLIKDIIIVANVSNRDNIAQLVKQYRISKVKDITLGGKRRQDSVYNGLKLLDKRTDIVLIHDAARPFIEAKSIRALIAKTRKYGAAILGVPVKATIKEVTRSQSHKVTGIKRTINRVNLLEIQTPQAFKKDLILRAYKRFGHLEVTDDAMLVERLGVKVRLVLGSYNNIKITTPEDLIIAKVIAKRLAFSHLPSAIS